MITQNLCYVGFHSFTYPKVYENLNFYTLLMIFNTNLHICFEIDNSVFFCG